MAHSARCGSAGRQSGLVDPSSNAFGTPASNRTVSTWTGAMTWDPSSAESPGLAWAGGLAESHVISAHSASSYLECDLSPVGTIAQKGRLVFPAFPLSLVTILRESEPTGTTPGWPPIPQHRGDRSMKLKKSAYETGPLWCSLGPPQ